MSKNVNRIGRSGWQKHIAAWSKSDLTQADYCRHHGLNARYFSVWKRRLLCEQSDSRKSPSFLPVEVVSAPKPPNNCVEIKLANGVRVQLPTDLPQSNLLKILQWCLVSPC